MEEQEFKKLVGDFYRSLLRFKSEFRDAAAVPEEAETDLRAMGVIRVLMECEKVLNV